MQELAFKTFSWQEQREFARVSGDFNPVHMDDVAARRTQAGRAVVHGMHLALWALDRLIAEGAIAGPLSSCKARFTRMVYVDETASLWIARDDGSVLSAQLRVGSVIVATLSVVRGTMQSSAEPVSLGLPPESGQEHPVEIRLQDLNGRSGMVTFADGAGSMFASAAGELGATRVQAIATISRLVGMVCPGLHSIAYSYQMLFHEGGDDDRSLAFEVEEVDERFRLVTQAVFGGGLSGTVVALARVPPVAQLQMSEVAAVVSPEIFASVNALVVGGSRGLGELTAKILAAGGANVTVTYAVGQREAVALCDEIAAFGGSAHAMKYDVRLSAAGQLSGLERAPNHLYYFATNAIFKRADGVFSRRTFDEFCQFYIAGFHDICQALAENRKEPLRVLYPSSVAVEERPAGMTEYAMAKAGGEMLCEDLNRAQPILKINVARLPRILTDQTATTTDVESADAMEVMLPLILKLLC